MKGKRKGKRRKVRGRAQGQRATWSWQQRGIVRDVELHGRCLAEVLRLRNKNSLFKKIQAVAHVYDSRVAAREQDDRRLLESCRSLLRCPRRGRIHSPALGVTLCSFRLLLCGFEPLDNSGLKGELSIERNPMRQSCVTWKLQPGAQPHVLRSGVHFSFWQMFWATTLDAANSGSHSCSDRMRNARG